MSEIKVWNSLIDTFLVGQVSDSTLYRFKLQIHIMQAEEMANAGRAAMVIQQQCNTPNTTNANNWINFQSV